MEIAEVVDEETLRVYLDALPKHEQLTVRRRVAFHAAARVLPIATHDFFLTNWVLQRSLTPVSFFGAVAISGVAYKTMRSSVDAVVDFTTLVADNTGSIVAAAASTAASAAAAISLNADAVVFAAIHAEGAMDNEIDFWDFVRRDLRGKGDVWPHGRPGVLQSLWADTVAAMQAHPADWSIWIHWYNRILQGRDWHPEAMGEVLQEITRDDWEKGPEHINPMFDEVLALYLKEDAATSDASGQDRSTNHVQTIRAQVFTLQEFLWAEYLDLAGRNARTPEQDDILELLKALKALVDDMIARLDGSDDERTLVVVRETLPAVIEQAGELAVIEPEPVVSSTVATMSATIKSLTEAGADPELATKFAISEAAGKKLWPQIKGLFGWK